VTEDDFIPRYRLSRMNLTST